MDSLINLAIQQRHIVIGGTSAGMAIQGKYYFSAQNGTVTSASALSNPYNSLVTVDSMSFLKNYRLENVITDTHFDNPDRKGRVATFLARIFTDFGVYAKAIACDEYTAVCIDTNGIANVFGRYPAYIDNAYFIQSNCELAIPSPENCTPGNPLTWNLGGQALKAYQIKGDSSGTKTFDLNNWQSGIGGTWLNWSVTSGNFSEQNGNALNCNSLSIDVSLVKSGFKIYPNPASDKIMISNENNDLTHYQFTLYTMLCQKMPFKFNIKSMHRIELGIDDLESGIYYLNIYMEGNHVFTQMIVRK